jgi:DNA-binding CsgD family transcriptional regulator
LAPVETLLTPEPVTERIHQLWDRLADFEVARVDAAVEHLLDVVADLVQAQNAYWLGAVRISDDERDPLHGWRPRLVRYLRSTPQDEAFARRAIRDRERGCADESTLAHARQAGRFRAPLLRELVDPSWFDGPFYQDQIAPRGIVDTLFVIFPVNDGAESYYGFHRIGSDARLFTEQERQTAAYAMRGLKWFHRHVMLSHGLLAATTPLSPTERRIVSLLLTEKSEKQIAAELKHSAATTHKYVTEIYRRFGVTSRAGLMALWLGKVQ